MDLAKLFTVRAVMAEARAQTLRIYVLSIQAQVSTTVEDICQAEQNALAARNFAIVITLEALRVIEFANYIVVMV
jgi:hypothetical protein